MFQHTAVECGQTVCGRSLQNRAVLQKTHHEAKEVCKHVFVKYVHYIMEHLVTAVIVNN